MSHRDVFFEAVNKCKKKGLWYIKTNLVLYKNENITYFMHKVHKNLLFLLVICHTVTSHRDNLDLTWKHHFNFFWPYVCLYKKPELFYFRIFENFICLDRTHFFSKNCHGVTSLDLVIKFKFSYWKLFHKFIQPVCGLY